MGSNVYDARIRPSGINATGTASDFFPTLSEFLDAATLVTVNIFVRSFSKIDDVKMVNIFFHPHNIYLNLLLTQTFFQLEQDLLKSFSTKKLNIIHTQEETLTSLKLFNPVPSKGGGCT